MRGREAVTSLSAPASDLAPHLHRAGEQLPLTKEVEMRQELNVILPLHQYWVLGSGEVTVAGGDTRDLTHSVSPHSSHLYSDSHIDGVVQPALQHPPGKSVN